MTELKNIVSDETVDRLWSRLEKALPDPKTRRASARPAIVVAVVALVVAGGGAGAFAAITGSSSSNEVYSEPGLDGSTMVDVVAADAMEYAKQNDVSFEEAVRRSALRPGLARVSVDVTRAAGDRYFSLAMNNGKVFGMTITLTEGAPVPEVDDIARANPGLVTVLYSGAMPDSEIWKIVDTHWASWQQKFPSLDHVDVIGGEVIFVTPNDDLDAAIREYVTNHGAEGLPVVFEHVVLTLH